MKSITLKLIGLFMIIILCSCFLQTKDKDLDRARAYFEIKDYHNTIFYYNRAQNLNDTSDLRKIAFSYFKTGHDLESLHYLKTLCKGSNHPNDQHLIFYGKILQRLKKYDQAKKQFNKIKKLPSFHLIASCDSVMVWRKTKSRLLIVNEKKINTEYNEMAPMFFHQDLLFCSDREHFIIKKKDQTTHLPVFNIWRASNIKKLNHPKKWSSSINTLHHDGNCSFNSSYDKIYMSKTILNGNKHFKPRLFSAEKHLVGWGDKKKFIYNDTSYVTTQPFITKDERVLFFVSNRPGGLGGLDIYACFNFHGKWTKPVNLGAPINSPGNERSPYLSEDGHLYFSSDYHAGYGGYDIFKSKQIKGRFKTINNLKAPINSSCDDFSFIIDSTNTQAFFTSNRPKGKGLDDIYSVKL